MDELLRSFTESIRKRASTTFFGTYAFFWAALNWQGLYSAIFTSEEKIYKKYGLLKNEYLNQYFFGYQGRDDWSFYVNTTLPFALTLGFIWIITPQILTRVFRKDKEHSYEKQKIKHEFEKKVEKERAMLDKLSIARLEEDSKKAQTTKKIEQQNPEVIWQDEYRAFRTSSLFGIFNSILDSFYKHGGHIQWDYNEYRGYESSVPQDILVYADVHDLIILDTNKETFELTEKGKFFIKNYTQEQILPVPQ